MTRYKRATLFTFVLILLATAVDVSAHGYLVRAIPEDRAVLERPPARVQYWFSEPLEAEFSSLNVRNQNGEIVATGDVDDVNNTLMHARLPNDLPDGAYIVELRPAFASDGHVVAESRVFFVGDEVGNVAGQSADDTARPLEVLWRAITLTAMMLLFGTFTLYSAVLVPAWGNPDHRAGLLPPRVMRRLNWIVGITLLIFAGGQVLALLQQTMAFFNFTSITQALDMDFISLVRAGSRFGDLWNARMVFIGIALAIFAASIIYRRSQPETVRPFWAANAWMMALVIGTYSAQSHAAGSLLWPWLGIAVDWLHAAAVGFWAGGIMALALILPATLQPLQGETRRIALLAALRRFSRYATAALFIVIATGIYSASNWITTPDEATTSFGAALGFKLLLAALLIAAGALHHIALHPARYQRFEALIARVQGFMPTIRLEAVIGAVVIASVGLLSATPVPVPELEAREAAAPTANHTVDDLAVDVTVTPGGPGVNTYDVRLTRASQAIDGATVSAQIVNPERDWRSIDHAAEPVDAGLYVAAGDDIDEIGQWWMVLDITLPDDADPIRAAFAWNITDDATVIESRPPAAANLLALALVMASVCYALYPAAKRLYDRLDLTPVNVLITTGVIIMTIFLLVLGYQEVSDTRSRYDARLNPPPQVVNSVLPDADSVGRGRDLYAEYCIAWQSVASDFRALRERAATIRDDELYLATVEGWRDLPPCSGNLSDTQRWDVVNYFRTLAPDGS
jgi:putative copper export protein/methionine-rich copper-binding protein CopC